ncbi:hypothetical protein NDU88_003229 [Pleurodeles waltl]|uniref:Endonuclease/exonuclease/phosphatase domain-containing protein n=1 Tax=Pleurodeles waltl TaxID=8319 RepID=A0AAV7W450_PLEWA|nr:hypothetical protein NDU88_003229 [Pleurodeles waltl]
MGKDRANKGTQQTRVDQYTAQNPGANPQRESPATSAKGAEPTLAQILAAIKSSSRATQAQIAAIAVDVNPLIAGLRVVAERSVATEQKVTCVQSDMDIFKASEAFLEDWIRKSLPAAPLSAVFEVERAHRDLVPPGAPSCTILQQELICYTGMPIVWAGDFNCVLDGALDRDPPKLNTKSQMTTKLRMVEEFTFC